MKYKNIERKVFEYLPFIDFLNANERVTFFESMNQMYLEKGFNIIDDSKTCRNLFFVKKGRIRVYRLSSEGKEITMYRIGNGETCILTLGCIIGHADFEGFAVVEEDSDLITIPSDVFENLFSSNSKFRYYFMQMLLEKMKDLMVLTEEVAFHGVNRRVAKYLLWHSEDANHKTLKVTHEEIASELGTAREVVSRMLKEFEKKYIVKLSRGTITILDCGALKDILDM